MLTPHDTIMVNGRYSMSIPSLSGVRENYSFSDILIMHLD